MTRRGGLWLGAALLLTATAAPASADSTLTRLTALRYSAATAGYLTDAAEDFEAANPGVDIKVDVLDPSQLRGALQSGFASNAISDIAVVDAGWLPELARDHRVEPLDAMMSGEFRSRFVAALLPPGQVAGKQYGLPFAVSTVALFTNKALLARAGIATPPATWDALLADSLLLKAAGIRALGLPGRGADAVVLWYCALWARGGELLGRDGRAAFASAPGIAALAALGALANDGATEDAPADRSAADVEAMFGRGEVAMVAGTLPLTERLAREAPTLPYAVSVMPQGSQPATLATADLAVVLSDSAGKSTAFHFLDYLFTRVPRLAFVKGERMLATTLSVARDRFFTKNEQLSAFTRQIATARFVPAVPGWDAAAAALADAVHAVLAGRSAAEPALQAAAARADAAMAAK